jgi:hypothetical protein
MRATATISGINAAERGALCNLICGKKDKNNPNPSVRFDAIHERLGLDPNIRTEIANMSPSQQQQATRIANMLDQQSHDGSSIDRRALETIINELNETQV